MKNLILILLIPLVFVSCNETPETYRAGLEKVIQPNSIIQYNQSSTNPQLFYVREKDNSIWEYYIDSTGVKVGESYTIRMRNMLLPASPTPQ